MLLLNVQYLNASINVRNGGTGLHQQGITKGTVIDNNGVALPGVTVSVKNGNASTSTDENGSFSITASSTDVLVFNMVGYESREVKVGNETTIKVVLMESSTGLDEVVVIGYG